MNKTTYDRGMEAGVEVGRAEGLRRALIRQGAKRFGQTPPEVEARLRTIQDQARLEELTERILDANSWEELLAGV
jgi:hypothetical protein